MATKKQYQVDFPGENIGLIHAKSRNLNSSQHKIGKLITQKGNAIHVFPCITFKGNVIHVRKYKPKPR